MAPLHRAALASIAVLSVAGAAEEANESAAFTTLRSAIFPAQIQFQGGAYRDADGDGRGEYSPDLRELAGGAIPGLQATLSLLPAEFNAERPVVNGYAYATHDLGESGFVAYAWPAKPGEGGSLVLAIMANGVVWRRPVLVGAAEPAAWDLWGGTRPAQAMQEPVAPWVKHQPPPAKPPPGPPRKSMAHNLRQIALASAVYLTDEKSYPPDLPTLVKATGGDLPERLLRSQKAPERADALLYVRPAPNGGSTQPMVIEDPACWDDRGCHLVFCDGRTGWLAGGAATRVWAEAKRLAASPKAAANGIAPSDWKAVQKLLDAAKPAKTEPPAAGPPDPDGVPDPEF